MRRRFATGSASGSPQAHEVPASMASPGTGRIDPGTRRIDEGDLEPALLAGLLLSAGGSGRRALHRHRAFGVEALRLGDVELVPASSLADTDDVIVATGVGAPG